MRYIYFVVFMSIIFSGCRNHTNPSKVEDDSAFASNITKAMISEWEWLNEPESFAIVDSSLSVKVKKGSDFFNNPEDGSVAASAPFLYQKIQGDFVAKTFIQPDFSSQWNAVSLMVYLDSLNWIKFAFENSDATGPGIVTVVTKGKSDDANGVILNEHKQVWLAIARKNNNYSMHWSLDGDNYNMARLTSMPEQNEINIGVETQSPVGDSATHTIHFFSLESRTVQDLRKL
ncbi:MAG: DUF1349 domain-containing protein [Bacteroidia bacterium]|nr:DUF1349 domain-containing protein [Bacteroidia bacterium]